MGTLLAIVLVAASLSLVKGRIGSARAARGAGKPPRPARSPRPSVVAHWIEERARRQKALIDDWVEQRRADRRNGTSTAPPVPPKPPVRGKVIPAVREPRPAGNRGRWSPPPRRPAAVPPQSPPQQPQPSQPSQPTGGAPVSTSAGPVEQLVEGINGIRAQAMAGGIHAKHSAIKAAVEGAERFSALMTSLARELSEPGMHYGPEITEPLSQMGQFLTAAANVGSESDASMTSLKSTTVGDLAASARQAPDRSELSETGAS